MAIEDDGIPGSYMVRKIPDFDVLKTGLTQFEARKYGVLNDAHAHLARLILWSMIAGRLSERICLESDLVNATPLRFNVGMPAGSNEAVEMTAVLWAASEGGFCALNPETGTTSQGETQAEALANLAEATELFLEEFPLTSSQRAVVTTFRVADVA